MTRKQAWLCVTALLLVLASAVWGTLVMAASSPDNRVAPVAAPITVTTTADTLSCGTPCSLRGAIMVASPRDTIEIPAGTYTLTLLLDLTIDKSLSLEGAGSGDTIIQAAAGEGIADFRVLKITGDSRPNVAISNVTIRHGGGRDGGGISNSGGTLTISGSTISG